MEGQPTPDYREEVIDLGKYFPIKRRDWRNIALLSLTAGIVTFLVTFLMQDIYQATAVIAPPAQDKKEIPAFGMLATFGVNLGGVTKVEDLESLFKSNDLTVRVFKNHNLWPILCKDRYDPATGKIKRSWVDRLVRGKESEYPGEWDAIRAAKNRLHVSINKRAGTVTVSFESPSPIGSSDIVRHYLDEGKNHLQEEALDRATRNKKFIEEQIGKTLDALTRDRFYSLLGQEVEQEMMARNREQFGFRVIDSPRAPDKATKPKRINNAAGVTFASFMLFIIFFAIRNRKRNKC